MAIIAKILDEDGDLSNNLMGIYSLSMIANLVYNYRFPMVDGRYNDLDHGVKLNEQTQLGGTTSQFDQKSYMNLI